MSKRSVGQTPGISASGAIAFASFGIFSCSYTIRTGSEQARTFAATSRSSPFPYRRSGEMPNSWAVGVIVSSSLRLFSCGSAPGASGHAAIRMRGRGKRAVCIESGSATKYLANAPARCHPRGMRLRALFRPSIVTPLKTSVGFSPWRINRIKGALIGGPDHLPASSSVAPPELRAG